MTDISRTRWEDYNEPEKQRCPKGHFAKMIHNVIICDQCGTSTQAPPSMERTGTRIIGGPAQEGVQIVKR